MSEGDFFMKALKIIGLLAIFVVLINSAPNVPGNIAEASNKQVVESIGVTVTFRVLDIGTTRQTRGLIRRREVGRILNRVTANIVKVHPIEGQTISEWYADHPRLSEHGAAVEEFLQVNSSQIDVSVRYRGGYYRNSLTREGRINEEVAEAFMNAYEQDRNQLFRAQLVAHVAPNGNDLIVEQLDLRLIRPEN